MVEDQTKSADRAKSITLNILDELLPKDAESGVGVRIWDGSLWPDEKPRDATIVLNHPGALKSMFSSMSEMGLAEAYLYDDFDIEGEIERVYDLGESLEKTTASMQKKLKLSLSLRRLPEGDVHVQGRRGPADLTGDVHSIDRDRQAISYHYDVSNDFYALWLDRNLVYSCAYFDDPEEDLDSAQLRKLDYICRKLRLKPGHHLLDIGCGWGGLVKYAAENYGVGVKGITLSQPQAELANQRLVEAGLDGKARVVVQDYREIEVSEGYDALVSVGMIEHVGSAKLGTYFKKAMEVLRPGGVFLNHGIASSARVKTRSEPTFSQRYVFPDGELTPINISLKAAEKSGFEVRDVESLREHYALTLRHWVHRLEENHLSALEFVSEPTYRVWRLFMSAYAYGFSNGRLNVYQSLLVKQDSDGSSKLPLTRADWYE
ncbi:MAG TPA: cyclopropane-fatty-acyl-phospholipid synthase family protein [Anaerolineales bacterium]|jgi:cyclopropane-fatty-acyl-phospholipid synthase|nr:cyclopropane-fatty-acyl-phospholipid synthase family protein [Anaerolineales bacterium]